STRSSDPWRSSARRTAFDGLTTVALKPGTLRQPSSSSWTPSIASSCGLIATISPCGSRPTDRSTTNRRRGSPTCGAASPMPGAAYIVSIMSSMSRSSSAVNDSISRARSWSGVSPYLRIGRIIFERHSPRKHRGREDQTNGLRDRGVFVKADRSTGRRSPRSKPLARAVPRGVPVGHELRDRVAPELLEERVGEHDGHHRFADDGGGGNGADVAALDRRGTLRHRPEIHGAQRLHEGGDRLHVRRDAEVLAVGDAALEAAGVVGRP